MCKLCFVACIALGEFVSAAAGALSYGAGDPSLLSHFVTFSFRCRLTPYEGDEESEARWEADLLSLVSQGELAVGRDMMRVLNPSA